MKNIEQKSVRTQILEEMSCVYSPTVEALWGLGFAMTEECNKDKVIAAYNKVIGLSKDDPNINTGLLGDVIQQYSQCLLSVDKPYASLDACLYAISVIDKHKQSDNSSLIKMFHETIACCCRLPSYGDIVVFSKVASVFKRLSSLYEGDVNVSTHAKVCYLNRIVEFCYDNGKYASAVTYFEKAIYIRNNDPKDTVDSLFDDDLIGIALESYGYLGRYSESTKLWENASSWIPSIVHADLLTEAYIKQKKYHKAEEICKSVMGSEIRNLRNFSTFVMPSEPFGLLQKWNYQLEHTSFNLLPLLSRQYEDASLWLTKVHITQNRYLEAEVVAKHMIAALKTDQKRSFSQYHVEKLLATAYMFQERFADAEDLYICIMKRRLLPAHLHVELVSNLINCLIRQDKYGDAVDVAHNMLKMDRDTDIEFVENMVSIFVARNRYRERRIYLPSPFIPYIEKDDIDAGVVKNHLTTMANTFMDAEDYVIVQYCYENIVSLYDGYYLPEGLGFSIALWKLAHVYIWGFDNYVAGEELYNFALEECDDRKWLVHHKINAVHSYLLLQDEYGENGDIVKALSLEERRERIFQHPESMFRSVMITQEIQALIHRDNGQHSKAELIYRRLLALQENNPYGYNNIEMNLRDLAETYEERKNNGNSVTCHAKLTYARKNCNDSLSNDQGSSS